MRGRVTGAVNRCNNRNAVMLDLLWSVGGFLVAISVLVAFHEFGHYWVARRCGVKVLRYSLGFGKVLWQRKLSSGIIGQPITYLGPDGHQYVAIPSGVGGAAGVQKARTGYPSRGSTLYVFSLDGVDNGQPAGDAAARADP